MGTWIRENGTWSEIEWDVWEEDRESEEWESAMRRHGFRQLIMVGEDDSFTSVTLHEREEGHPRYLVSLTTVSNCVTVAAATLPDAMDVLASYAPIVQAMEIATAMYEIGSHTPGILDDIMAGLVLNRAQADSTVSMVRQRQAEGLRRAAERERRAASSQQ
jgi:hypothetical protein